MLKKILIVLGVLVVIAAGGVGYLYYSVTKGPYMAKAQAMERQPAPIIALKTFPDKNEVSLGDLIGKDKPVYLNFWATWCPPCVHEMPFMNELYPEYKDKMDFVIASVDAKQDDVVKFQEKNNYSFPIYYADNKEAAQAYGIQGIPTSILIDGKGNVINVHIGSMSKEDMKSFLDGAFK